MFGWMFVVDDLFLLLGRGLFVFVVFVSEDSFRVAASLTLNS